MHDAKPQDSPGRYGPHIAVMREMNWSWSDLINAPVDLVDEVLLHISYQRQWDRKRSSLDKQRAKKHGI